MSSLTFCLSGAICLSVSRLMDRHNRKYINNLEKTTVLSRIDTVSHGLTISGLVCNLIGLYLHIMT